MDFAELDKINDLSIRNKVLDKIGTPNFKWELQQAIDREKNEKNKALIIAELQKFATEVKSDKGFQWVRGYHSSQITDITAPVDADTVEYFFYVSEYGSITLLKKSENNVSSAPDRSAQEEKQKEFRERNAALEEISKRAYRLRYEFVSEISNATAKKNMGVIIEYSLRAMIDDYYNVDYEDYIDFLGIETKEDNEEDEDDYEFNFDTIAASVKAQPERHMLVAVYLMLDSEREHYYNYSNQHLANENLNTIYDFLEKLGYKTSEEELALRNGTHELFQSENREGA